ncbi:LPS export ABC transporter periplasmic protein LptC [Rhodobacteraceae bacterium]|nr:LPS export ABC transporter periplasmic protein LptC [Paracoccaceae bacterium]
MPAIQISYSNTIFYLKLALFFAGLFAIILIFLSAKKIEPSTEVPFAKDVNVTSLNDGLTKPLHSSITNSGDVLQIMAEQIILTDEKDAALVKSVSFTISTGEGSKILLSAKKAILRQGDKSLTLKENVILKAADKLRLNAKEIYTALDRTLVMAVGPVSGLLSNTKIDAGQLYIFRERASTDLVISFTKGVKMIYDNN